MIWLKKIFIFVFFLFILGETIRVDFSNGFAIRPLDIGIGIILAFWVLLACIKKNKVKKTSAFSSIVIFALCGMFSLAINSIRLSPNEFLVSLSYLLRWIAYAGIFFVTYSFSGEFKMKISRILIAVGSLTVLFGYLQYFFYNNLKNLFYLGWDEHMYRMFSVFFDPNFAGAIFVLFFLFLADRFFRKKSIPIGLLLVLTLGSVFLTFSRSALIMLIVSSSLLLVLLNKKKWIAILSGIIILFLSVSSRYFNIENINLLRVVSSEARLETSKKAVEIIKANPAFGVGFNAYRYAKFDYNFKNDKSTAISHADAGVDNSFLFVIATTGIIGFAAYLYMWFRILKIASILATASIAGVFVNSMFINSLFYPFIMLWIWIILALSSRNHN